MKRKILVVGAGFSGAVVARQLAERLSCSVLVIDQREHLGGNCHTERDVETGIMVHRYGPHIFNTDNERVWEFVRNYGDFRPFINRVKAVTTRGVFSLPINLLTINQFFGKTFSPGQAEAFVKTLGDSTIGEPATFEEQALKFVGRDLYEAFFEGYTVKQWGAHPRDLPASILKRLPVRFTYDDNYYNRRFQGIPAEGYTEVIKKILTHPSISIRLGESFDYATGVWSENDRPTLIVYTGPIDSFFNYSHGRLGYRTVTFERIPTTECDYQGNAVVNYTSTDVPWTRIHEHKHFAPWETHDRTVAFREFSKETGADDIPYYPKRLSSDMRILKSYRNLAEQQSDGASSSPMVSFLGRLATYRYMDMETVIGEALEFADVAVDSLLRQQKVPTFPNEKL